MIKLFYPINVYKESIGSHPAWPVQVALNLPGCSARVRTLYRPKNVRLLIGLEWTRVGYDYAVMGECTIENRV